MSYPQGLLVENCKIVQGLEPITPSSTTPDYVSMKNYDRLTIILTGVNATTVTGSAITLKQASAVAGTGEKALALSTMWANLDTAASDTLVETAVVSDTFTTLSTNSKKYVYVMEVKASSLDVDGGFDCVRVGTGNAVATTVSAVYILWNSRYAGPTPPAAITD